MTPTPPPRPPQTMLGHVTQMMTKVRFSLLKLKPDARVPELWVQSGDSDKADVYPLVGDRYLLGRSSRNDIVVRNPVVSQTHLSLNRDSQGKNKLSYFFRAPFVIQDEGSTNGIYRRKRRIQAEVLQHGAVYTLGPAELAESVRLKYVDPPPWYKRAVQYSMYGITGITLLTVAAVLIEWQKFSVRPLPTSVQGPVVIYARDGETPLRPVTNRPHQELPRLSDYPRHLRQAVIASEDSRFFWHFGIDPIGTLRALVVNLRGGSIREGGSGLTQQLARNLFREYVGTDDSAARKLREAAAALKLETFYSKDFLLLLYLNRVYLGSGNYGFEDAARFYFDKSAKELTLSEAATLVGMLPGPNLFNPVRDYEKAVEQRNGVLQRMAELGMISGEEASRARRSRIEVSPKAREELENVKAPYFYDHVFAEIRDLLGDDIAKEGNFIVLTGLDLNLQAKAETALRNAVANQGRQYGFSQGAIVTLDAQSGHIRALVGGTDYEASQFNRATQALRQPGSTFKVFAYTAALNDGMSPGTTFSCAPLTWEGQNYRGCERSGGNIDMYTGLAQSENVVALRVAQAVGLGNVVRTAKEMGLRSELKAVPGLVLGQSEVTPLEMTGAFAVFANGGVYNRPRAVRQILDGGDCKDPNDYRTCRVIYSEEDDSERNRQVLTSEVANVMTELLRGVVRGGTGQAAAIGAGEAGKTGTTDFNVDLWFVGYIPNDLVTGIWLGNDDNSPTSGSSGQAARLWGDYMRRAIGN